MRLFVLLTFFLLWAVLPASARAQQVQRCVGADGRAVYTDQRCDAVGAVERLPPAAREDTRVFRDACPRTLSQLVGEIGAAVKAHDVNRLASLYDWAGVSDSAAGGLLDRLEGVVARPLVDIAPVYPYASADGGDATAAAAATSATPAPEAPAGLPPASGPARWMPSWSTTVAPGPAGADVDAGSDIDTATGTTQDAATPPPSPPARPRPIALRIEQTLAGSATPSRTVFGLRRAFGCFWISL